MTRESLAAKVIETGGKLTVRSALNPILWLCAIITIPSLCIASFKTETPDWLIFLIIAPVCVAIVGFLFLLFIDRDKLQSEEYQLKKKSLELFQEKGESPTLIDTETIELSENKENVIEY